jgi:hypothetical protein
MLTVIEAEETAERYSNLDIMIIPTIEDLKIISNCSSFPEYLESTLVAVKDFPEIEV